MSTTARIGPMRHRVAIQRRTVAQNSYGEAVPTWSTLATRWGRLEPLTGREAWQAQQARPDVTHRLTLRYYAGLLHRDRVQIDGATYQVESVTNPDGRKRFHELILKQEVS